MQRRFVGSLVGVVCVVALGAALLPFRSHISVSTAGLVLVIPVVIGSVRGGFYAGIVSVAAGFLVYDFEYVPPYRTLNVGTTQNWTALVVYVIVMLLVARVVASLDAARSEARHANDATRRLYDLSELLVGDRPVDDLLTTIVQATHTVFGVAGVSLLVLKDDHLRVVAFAGDELTNEELRQLEPESGMPVSVGTARSNTQHLRTIALAASGRPVGILAMSGLPVSDADRAVLNTFANDAALALERAQLREQALRSQLLEEVDRLRRGLMGAVSHDLRTPLSTIKVASSTLSDRSESLSPDQTFELLELIEIETDRLTRLVTNLLDMTRIEAGVFAIDRAPARADDIVRDAVDALGPTLQGTDVKINVPSTLPIVDVDRVLVGQVLVNLLDNAARHNPPNSLITVTGELRNQRVTISVADEGPGVAPSDREAVFDRFAQFDTGGRAGLGLTIAKTFVEAHGERIWYETAPGGGARFVFSLPLATDGPKDQGG
ncbi:MAG TPA: ATP-binding protein [Acidimicrobiales bacterium]